MQANQALATGDEIITRIIPGNGNSMPQRERPAGLQYVGLPGVSISCVDAVFRFVQYGNQVQTATILTAGSEHALLLELEVAETIAVKTGFTSGYSGTGPHAFAEVLELLSEHGTEIEERLVPEHILRSIDGATLTESELESVMARPVVRPSRWYDYIHAIMGSDRDHKAAWKGLPPVMPWRIIDARLLDLAKKFQGMPDYAILTGFRRLEDIVRARTGLDEHGAKLFSQAFHGDSSKLCWDKIPSGEQSGRAQMFTGAFSAFRNPRAHKEVARDEDLAEFLSLNQLFCLEAKAIDRPPVVP